MSTAITKFFTILTIGLMSASISVPAATILPSVSSGTLKLHLSADTNVTASGGSVSAWGDQSGGTASFDQTDTDARPTLVSSASWVNDQPVIQLDGSADFLQESQDALDDTKDAAGLSGAFTLFITARSDRTGGNPKSLFSSAKGAADNQVRFWEDDAVERRSDSPEVSVSLDEDRGSILAVRYEYQDTMDVLEKNVDDGLEATASQNTGNSAYVNWNDPAIGGIASSVNSAVRFDGEVFEVVLYEGALSDTDQDAVVNAMFNTANIPEPTTVALLGLALTALLGRRPRRRE